jgi:hypothetical protein
MGLGSADTRGRLRIAIELSAVESGRLSFSLLTLLKLSGFCFIFEPFGAKKIVKNSVNFYV